MGETAPGWYPDPSGKPMQRYFDGTEWTEHYAAAGVPAPARPPTPPVQSAAATPKTPAKIGRFPAWLVVGAAVLVLMGGCIAINASKKPSSTSSSSSSSSSTTYQPPAPPTFSAALIESTVIDTCHQAVQKGLKDPDSAKFDDDWKAWKVTAPGSKPPAGMDYSPFNNDEYWNAAGMVNAKNSFGGYVGGQPYSCDAVVSAGGNVRARAHPLELPTP